MSAGPSASGLLFSLVAAIVLFGVFAGVSSLNILEEHAYMPGFGWEEPTDNAAGLHGVCEPTTATSGFPIADSRQAAAPDNCLKATNPLAKSMNFALYFATAAIIAVAMFERIRHRL